MSQNMCSTVYQTQRAKFKIDINCAIDVFFFRHAGTIYAFLFSADIINNLMVATLQKYLRDTYGYLGLFLIVSLWGLVALAATYFYPR